MTASSKRRFLYRILLYIAGLFLIALGSCISINSGLGISPVSSLPYVISLIAGLPLSGCVIAIYSLYVLLQIVILRGSTFKNRNKEGLPQGRLGLGGPFLDFGETAVYDGSRQREPFTRKR